MSTALSWIPRGITPSHIEQVQPNKELVDQYLKEAKEMPQPEPEELSPEDAQIAAKFNMENYDNEDEITPEMFGVTPEEVKIQHTKSDDEDEMIRPTDCPLVTGKFSEEVAPSLEFLLFDPSNGDFYSHHIIEIEAPALSLSWMNPKNDESFMAISTMNQEIEIRNMKVIQDIPDATLKLHTDSVPTVTWNPLQQVLLLSGDVSGIISLWNLTSMTSAATYNINSIIGSLSTKTYDENSQFSGNCPVMELDWSLTNPSVFIAATGAGTILLDARSATAPALVASQAFMNSANWLNETIIISGGNNGYIIGSDIRNPTVPVFKALAHDGEVSCVRACRAGPGFATVGSEDETVKIWSLKHAITSKQHVELEEMKMGSLFYAAFNPDIQTLLAVSGAENNGVMIWDIDPSCLDRE